MHKASRQNSLLDKAPAPIFTEAPVKVCSTWVKEPQKGPKKGPRSVSSGFPCIKTMFEEGIEKTLASVVLN